MALSVLAIQSFLAANAGLTALVPGNNIWLGLAGDGSLLPWIVLTQVNQLPTWLTGKTRLTALRLQVDIYASTLGSVDTITAALLAALPVNAAVTSNTWGCLLTAGPDPMAETGGAYRSKTEYVVWEELS